MEDTFLIPFGEKNLNAILSQPFQPSSSSRRTQLANDCCIILTHGAGGDMMTEQLCILANHLNKAGFKVLRFTCKPPNFKYRVKAFSAVLAFAKTELKSLHCIIIGGRSMGGRVAAEIAKNLSSEFLFGVFCISYPLHRPNQFNMLRTSHLLPLTIPLLIINGTKEKMCRKDLMDDTVAELLCDVTMHWIQDADHSLVVKSKSSEEVTDRVCSLLTEWCESRLCKI